MIWEPDLGLPQFIGAGYVDDQLVGHYSRRQRKVVPQISWGKEMEKEEPQIWEWINHRIWNDQLSMKVELRSLQKLYNQSTGLHILQRMTSCELSNDGRKRGFYQFGYNGKDYLNFDKETLTWTAATGPALVTKMEWDAELANNQCMKDFLEEICIGWLQTFLDYGKASLLRTEPPKVKVAREEDYDGLETLICQAHGFYPKEIDATWWKDGEIWEQETFRGGVVPNSDGTFHTWLSVKIHPKDRDRYQCHVEHDALLEPLDVTWEEPELSKVVLIAAILMVVLTGLFVPVIIYFWRRPRNYQAAHRVAIHE
uniref:Uncharacterized protein n=2 Tax=Sphaerodactylus townsendi TaxID=933632 RepID=A0ACB8EF92_9SAUR